MRIKKDFYDSNKKSRFFILLLFCFLLLITNNIISFDHSITSLAAGDTYSYTKIAKSFPHFPDKKISYHHAQRFIFPFLIGMIANISGMSYEIVFSIVTIVLFFAIVIYFHQIIEQLNLSLYTYIISISIFIFNPYTFRFHISFPGILIDLVFVLGLCKMFLGFYKRSFPLVFIGVLVMAVGRQTALLCIPGIILYLFFYEGWRYSRKTKYIQSFLIIVAILLTYFITGFIASFFSLRSDNLIHILGLFFWVFNDFNLTGLFLFILRLLLTFILPLSILFGLLFSSKIEVNRNKSSFVFCVVFTLLICSQPILGGPNITGNNIQRLAALSFTPFLLAFSILFEESNFAKILPPLWLVFIVVAIVISSLHHLYIFTGPNAEKNIYFASIHFFVSFLIFLVVYFLNKNRTGINRYQLSSY